MILINNLFLHDCPQTHQQRGWRHPEWQWSSRRYRRCTIRGGDRRHIARQCHVSYCCWWLVQPLQQTFGSTGLFCHSVVAFEYVFRNGGSESWDVSTGSNSCCLIFLYNHITHARLLYLVLKRYSNRTCFAWSTACICAHILMCLVLVEYVWLQLLSN